MKPYYEDDFVTLYHGDCLEVTEWLGADVLVTDPPYGIAHRHKRTSGKTKHERRKRSQERRAQGGVEYHGVANDNSTEARDLALQLWGTRPALVFGTWRRPRPANTIQRLIWHKADQATGLASPQSHPWISKDEEIDVLGQRMGQFNGNGRVDGTVYTTSESRGSRVRQIGHPTPKPLDLMETLIEKCPPGVVADPFAGSGSTLVAAKRLGRRAIGVELEEKYCEIAVRRLSQDVLDFEGLTA